MDRGNSIFTWTDRFWIWCRKVAQRRYIVEGKEYLLRVIYEEREDMYEVVTAYLTSQIERYWKGGEDENRI